MNFSSLAVFSMIVRVIFSGADFIQRHIDMLHGALPMSAEITFGVPEMSLGAGQGVSRLQHFRMMPSVVVKVIMRFVIRADVDSKTDTIRFGDKRNRCQSDQTRRH